MFPGGLPVYRGALSFANPCLIDAGTNVGDFAATLRVTLIVCAAGAPFHDADLPAMPHHALVGLRLCVKARSIAEDEDGDFEGGGAAGGAADEISATDVAFSFALADGSAVTSPPVFRSVP